MTQRENSFGLTLLQRAYLIGRDDSVEIGNVASHAYHEYDGCWDADRLESALRTVVARHGILRTWFTSDGRQVTEPAVEVQLGRLDLRDLTPDEQRAKLAELREERSHRKLPLGRAPLIAADLTLLSRDRMRLHVSTDGLALDDISRFLFFIDWWRCYTEDAPPPWDDVPFSDYVAALDAAASQRAARRARAYWLLDRLDDLPPHPALPLRTNPAAITRPRFTQHRVTLDETTWSALKSRAASAGLTPTTVLMTAYAEVLSRWGAGHRFTLTTTVTSRPPIHPGIADALGNFSVTLLAEVGIDRNQAFAERAQALQARLERDLEHRQFSGIEVLRELAQRDSGADARMPFTFSSAIGYVREDVDGGAVELFGPLVYTSSQTPQVWLNAFAFESSGAVVVQVDEVNELFPDGMISAMLAGYSQLLDRLATGDAAWSATGFDLLPADQAERRAAANATAVPPSAQLLPEAFLDRAASDPDAPAVLSTSGTLSYGELAQAALSAAAWLRERQAGRDELVGLIMRRGPEQIVGIMATILAGAAYLPVDARLSPERVRYMLRDGRVRLVLSNVGWASDPPGELEVLEIGEPGAAAPDPGRWQPLPGATPDDLAYVLYTSGTTGAPKGVMISQRSVVNVVTDCNDRFAVGPGDRFIGVSAFNFDLSAYDVFGALSAGAAIVLPDADRAADPAHWLELCDRFGVTIWNSVPAIAGLLAEQAAAGGAPALGALTALRLVMMSGDRIPPQLPTALWQLKPELRLQSLGGPTETTIWNISHPIDAGRGPDDVIPYGRPNRDNRAYILDADGLDCPDWVTGEICAAGTGLARGYWADEALTAERFWFDERRRDRLYRTGDLGRYRPDGTIEIVGRSDFQIKVNGYRIEAGEVETRLAALDAVRQAAVVRQAGARGDRLVAHLVPAGDARPGADEVSRALREYLPDYMTPSSVVWHDSLPLTSNGKVDRRTLATLSPPASGIAPARAGTGPNTDIENQLAELWASVLRVPADAVGADSDFYELGGDSLAGARVCSGVRKQFGVTITLDRLYELRIAGQMAACIAGQVAAS